MTNTWSTPYYGVSHILREQSGQHQFTVEDHNTFAIATIASQQDAALVAAMARQAAEDREVIELCIAAGCTLAEAAAGIKRGIV